MAIRPRLLALSLVTALVVSVPVGWALSRSADGVPDDELVGDVVLDTPGEFQQPLDDGSTPTPGVVAGDGTLLPTVTLADGAGLEVSTAQLRGTPSVVNVWFSTCPPCAREMADLAEVHREIGDRVRFVGVNPFDDTDVMQRFAADRGVAYELWRDTDGVFVDAASVISFPRTYLVDASGVIVAETGVVDADELRRLIQEWFSMEWS